MHNLDALCTDAKMETNTCIEGLQHGSSTFSMTAILLCDNTGDMLFGDTMTNNAACR